MKVSITFGWLAENEMLNSALALKGMWVDNSTFSVENREVSGIFVNDGKLMTRHDWDEFLLLSLEELKILGFE